MYKKLNCLLLLSLLSAPLEAAKSIELQEQQLTLKASLGYLTGRAEEFVYDPDQGGAQLSHLVWRMEAVPIIRAAGSYQINSWLSAHLSGWINLKKGEGLMDDYDWLPPFLPFFMWSHHPDTRVQQANEVDAQLSAWFVQQAPYKLGAILGYQRNLYSFVAKGGCFNYYFGAYTGCFPSEQIGIGYKQNFNLPYLGLKAQYFIKNWDAQALVKFSNLVNARDLDQHYLRNQSFYEAANNFNYLNAQLNLGYHLSPKLKLFGEGSYNYIPNKKTGTVILDYENDERADIANAAGLSNSNYLLSFGIQYST